MRLPSAIYHLIWRVSTTIAYVDFLFIFVIAVGELRATGKFSSLSLDADEAEHSVEMHLPYVRKVFEGYVLSFHTGALMLSFQGKRFRSSQSL